MPKKTATIFHLDSDFDVSALETLTPWMETNNAYHMGTVPINGEAYLPLKNSGAAVRFRISQKLVPTSAITHRLRHLTKKTKAVRRERAKKRIEIHDELVDGIPHSHSETDVLFTSKWFIVMSSADVCVDRIISKIRNDIGSFEVKRAEAKQPLLNTLTKYLNADNHIFDNVKLGDSMKVDLDGMVSTMRYIDYDDETMALLERATECHHVELMWNDIYARVSKSWQLHQIDCDFDDIDPEDDPEHQERARLLYLSERLPLFIKDIAAHAGGLA